MKGRESETEKKILSAAKKVFISRGLYGARMQDIADEAGINKALLHYYFRNKEKLFDKVFEGALTKYFDNLAVFLDDRLPVTERLNQYVDNIIDFYSEYPQMSIFIIKEISSNPKIFGEKVAKIRSADEKMMKESGMGVLMNDPDFPDHIDFYMFLVNIHSLCAYPFIAKPIFNAIATKKQLDNEDPGYQRLKASIKEFIQLKIAIEKK